MAEYAPEFAPRLRWSDLAARLRRPGTGWLVAFTATLFLSAALLFAVQPMVAKMVLPLLGGAPATWITSLLFFQTVLLCGYAYAHWSTRWLGVRRQLVIHVVLIGASLLVLPIAVPPGWEPDAATNPVAWLLLLLVVSVGLPFFVLSATGPLLQWWFTSTPHASARDPYFLYRASNLGSIVALLAYPVLIEPRLRLVDQGTVWGIGYVGLAALTGICAVSRWRAAGDVAPGDGGGTLASPEGNVAASESITVVRRCRWVALAFVPSLFMLAVTTHITTDIAAVPLLWVIPLALYLLSFIVAFSPRPSFLSALMRQAQPFFILELVVLIVLRVGQPVVIVVAVNLLALYLSALVCHSRLAEDRPPSERLTEFYLWVALGGALGGVFSAVVAPVLFVSVIEYPLAIVLACLCRPPRPAPEDSRRSRRLDVLVPIVMGIGFVALVALGRALGLSMLAAQALPLAAAVVLCVVVRNRPVRFGLAVAAVLTAAALPFWSEKDRLHADRSFFGVLRVDRDEERGLHLLVHGNTVHGIQSLDSGRRLEPLSYYGPVGEIFDTLPGAVSAPEVGVIGLGTGSLACYGRPAQHWTFYEIDPSVERLARDPRLFSYLRDCPPRTDVVLGDARRSLSDLPGRRFGVLVVDAFNSDAIPVHLLTRQALALYLDRLANGGVIAVHVSNRYLDLRGVVADLAHDAQLSALVRDDLEVTDAEEREGRVGSLWVVMARRPDELAALARHPAWEPLPPRPGSKVWTDDFSNLLGALKRD